MTRGRSLGAALCLILLTATVAADEPAMPPDPSAVEFFEKSVRPILVERCIGCHGPDKQKGELRLDSRASALAGGTTGPAVEPGDAESSLLVEAIRYGGEVQMPPKSKLPQGEIDVLTRWVAEGAAWGVESGETAAETPRGSFEGTPEFERRARFWSFQRLKRAEPPAVDGPMTAWASTPIDRFLAAELASHNLTPAPEADRRTLIRRLTFDLIGLPPTVAEVEAFVAAPAADAYDRLVDQLLADPRYGERQGRHWLDLVRYAETAGHEFDYDILNAWRYRDYVVRACNLDLPYDQFVVEQLAGDLLPGSRRNSVDGSNESILGTGFYWLGEGVHSPLDVRDEGVRRVDNQIDVLSKTFLGLTVSCARCHDHKFDPIGTRDYYALAGFMRSTRHQQAFVDSDVSIAPLVGELRARGECLARLAAEAGSRTSATRKAEIETLTNPGSVLEPDPSFPASNLATWRSTGDAFEVASAGRFRVDLRGGSTRFVSVPPGSLQSGLVSDRLQGVTRSPTFTIGKKWLHLLASGAGGRINVVIDGFEKVRDPIYGGLTRHVDSPDASAWVTIDVATWTGHRAYLEACDGASAEFTGATTRPVPGAGWLGLLAVRESDDATPPQVPSPSVSIDAATLVRELDPVDSPLAARLAATLTEYREIEARIPDPTLAPAAVDGDGEDEFVMLRGNPRTPGEASPRKLLSVLGGSPQPGVVGSGRLDLARSIVDVRSNPLTPRVMVNRIWKQHFGEGLVRSTDDFGKMGQAPSHPELLDWLATEFVARGWSVKAMHRMILGSSAYRMASRSTAEADRLDPTNVYLHRQNVRRLEAEAVRDALLAVSGRLDARLGGPSVPPYLSAFMDGRGRPAKSGPLDGDGRRSLYLQVRRNFLNPMFMVFDAPVPFSTMGRRHASNVPAQALTLLNDPSVLALADAWAARLLASAGEAASDAERIDLLYRTAFGRPATADEVVRCSAYLRAGQAEGPPPHAAWADLCHALFNVKEFVYVD